MVKRSVIWILLLVSLGIFPSGVRAAEWPAEDASVRQDVLIVKQKMLDMEERLGVMETLLLQLLEGQKKLSEQMQGEHGQIRKWIRNG